ncbi:M18 family aminopeptidase [Nakamurella antarctica]|uniref:M18 family aminopeptidase n=2 Tax=Nakamurella antarctica TaxID=1902245 RepID=A0A3G8ZPW2_9ACTN|nr:M18 family aminopeptidase [Nakamurella antarctica]
MASYITAGVTPHHVCAETARQLSGAGFVEQDLREEWNGGTGGHFCVVDGTIVAWWVPEGSTASTGLRIIAAHTDSPVLKVKPRPDTGAAGWQQVAVEVYGGALWNSWLDRDLGIAGRVALVDGSSHLIRIDQPLLRIPQLAPHLDRGINTRGLTLNPQQHLLPLWGTGPVDDGVLMEHLCAETDFSASDVVGHDLLLHDLTPPSLLGREQDLLAAPRLDNLSSSYAGLTALLQNVEKSPHADVISVFAAFDHEEVGSGTFTGAGGPLLSHIIRRIGISLGGTEEELGRMLAASRCLSADAAHAVNPNYLSHYDPGHYLQINQGPALKVNADQHYGTDAIGTAAWIRACRTAEIPTQTFVGRNDVTCGSTLGKFVATSLGVRTVDVGIPILSMHSTRELGGVLDAGYLVSGIAEFLLDPAER